MILTAVIFLAVGGILVWFGRRCYQGDISVLQEYHRSRVAPEDVPALGKGAGRGLALSGGSMMAAAILAAAGAATGGKALLFWGAGVFAAGFAAGLILMLRAIKKYNHGIF